MGVLETLLDKIESLENKIDNLSAEKRITPKRCRRKVKGARYTTEELDTVENYVGLNVPRPYIAKKLGIKKERVYGITKHLKKLGRLTKG